MITNSEKLPTSFMDGPLHTYISACRNLTTLMEKEMTKSNVCKRQGGKKIKISYVAKGSRTNT